MINDKTISASMLCKSLNLSQSTLRKRESVIHTRTIEKALSDNESLNYISIINLSSSMQFYLS